MAKYVYHVPERGHGCGQVEERAVAWNELAYSFGKNLQAALARYYGLDTDIYPARNGVELVQGGPGMGKDWFSFNFRVLDGRAVYIDMLNIPLEWRHEGIGIWLVDELERFAVIYGLKCICLEAFKPASTFWERCGFIETKEYPDFMSVSTGK